MIKIQNVVRDIILGDEEALYALSRGYLNLSAYARQIQREVEKRCMKQVKASSIVVSLSRIWEKVGKKNPLIYDVKINNITTKSPLSEIIFEKTPELLRRLSDLYEKIKMTSDEFLAMTLSTAEVTVICSERIKNQVLKYLVLKPRLIESGLASIGLSLDPKYYHMPNITFSLIRRIARERIVLAETITTHTEIIFVFPEKNLGRMTELFRTQIKT